MKNFMLSVEQLPWQDMEPLCLVTFQTHLDVFLQGNTLGWIISRAPFQH